MPFSKYEIRREIHKLETLKGKLQKKLEALRVLEAMDEDLEESIRELLPGGDKPPAQHVLGAHVPSSTQVGTPEVKVGEPPRKRTAAELIVETLVEQAKPLTLGQIAELVEPKGYDFARQSWDYAAKKMMERDELVQVDAPKGSGASYAYLLPTQVETSDDGSGDASPQSPG